MLTPAANLEEVLDVTLLALRSADRLVGFLIETVAGDSQDVQKVSYTRRKRREGIYKPIKMNVLCV